MRTAGEALTLGAGHGVDSLEPRLLPPQRMQQARLEGEQRQRQQPGFVSYYLAAGHVMARDVAKGEILRLEDVHGPRDTVLFKLRQQQEALRDEDWAPPPPQQQKLSDERQAELSVVGVGEQARL